MLASPFLALANIKAPFLFCWGDEVTPPLKITLSELPTSMTYSIHYQVTSSHYAVFKKSRNPYKVIETLHGPLAQYLLYF